MIDQTVLDKLEFHKILQFISQYSVTERGKAKVNGLKPLSNISLVKLEGGYVTQAKEILISQHSPPFEFIPDLDATISQSRIDGALLDSRKILEIFRLAVISRNIFQFLKKYSDLAPDLHKLSESLFVDKVFEHHITKIINENGDVKDNASTKLSEIKKEMNL